MKTLNQYISEKLILKKNLNKKTIIKKFFPKTKDELTGLIEQLIEERGKEADLNDIDTSAIKDMYAIFHGGTVGDFNGDISEWDVSNVTDMSWMFWDSPFNGDISKWDVSKVKDMSKMFGRSQFNGDISNWNVSEVKDVSGMFEDSNFNRDISKWYLPNVNKRKSNMFLGCNIKDEYKPKFKFK